MATFNNFAQFQSFDTYKAALRNALKTVGPSPKKFQYFRQFPFGGAKKEMLLVDFDDKLAGEIVTKTKVKPTATGKCVANEKKELVFNKDSGALQLDALKIFVGGIYSERPVFVPVEDAPQGSGLPNKPLPPLPPIPGKGPPNKPLPPLPTPPGQSQPQAWVSAKPGQKQPTPPTTPQPQAKLPPPKPFVTAKPDTSKAKAPATKIGTYDDYPIRELRAEKDLQKRIDWCEKVLEKPGPNTKARDEVETILAEAKRDWGVEMAKKAYALQMKGVAHAGNDKEPALNPGGKFNAKNLEQKDMIFQDAKVKKLMKDTGLTEGEVIAIRAYTASNYKHINPAVANQKDRADKPADWMDVQNRPDPSKAKDPLEFKQLRQAQMEYDATNPKNRPNPLEKGISPEEKAKREKAAKEWDARAKELRNAKGTKTSLYEEGALHAGMMTEAFKKLPKKSGKLYRGARMTASRFNSEYQVGKVIKYEAFVSQTTSPGVAREFANGGGDFEPPADATTSVFVEAQVFDARDMQALSVYGSGEAEWLMAPGSMLRVEKIEDDSQKDVGRPPAVAWKKVTLVQIPPAPPRPKTPAPTKK